MRLELRNSVKSLFLALSALFASQHTLAEAPAIGQQFIRYCSGQWGDGDCMFSNAVVPDYYSVSQLRNFVQTLDARLNSLEVENTALKKRIDLLEAYPANQCTIEVIGTCSTVPSWSNKSFVDSSGMLLKNSGLNVAECQGRAKAYFDRCGGGVTVFSTFTNSRKRFKFPVQ